jgi:hypothetical protein
LYWQQHGEANQIGHHFCQYMHLFCIAVASFTLDNPCLIVFFSFRSVIVKSMADPVAARRARAIKAARMAAIIAPYHHLERGQHAHNHGT